MKKWGFILIDKILGKTSKTKYIRIIILIIIIVLAQCFSCGFDSNGDWYLKWSPFAEVKVNK
jgi:hypothetical protein